MIKVADADVELLHASTLFDGEWYVGEYPDVRLARIEPARHYLWIGARLGRRPSPDFDPAAYLALHRDVARAGLNPLLHYLRFGREEGRALAAAETDTPAGAPLAATPSPDAAPKAPAMNRLGGLFDAEWYLRANRDVAASGMDPWDHYQTYGAAEQRNPNSLFDAAWYLAKYPDVAAAGVDPVEHYRLHGAAEGREPGPGFSAAFYALQVGKDPAPYSCLLAHYLAHRDRPGLLASPGMIDGARLADTLGSALSLAPVRVDVGVVAYKQPLEDILHVLASARASAAQGGDAVRCRLMVFDNGDTLRAADLPDDVELLSNGRNDGFGCSHNLLMKHAFEAGADAYIAANPDGAFHPDCIPAMLRMNQRHGGIALVEAIQFPEDHPKFYHPETLETEWISGACFLITPQIWRKTGGFDEKMFLYCEDVDLSWAARRAGFATLTCPAALFYHDVSDRGYSARIWREMLIAGRYLAHKWGGADFRKFTETELLNKEFFKNAREFPVLDPAHVLADGAKFANFAHNFSFSRVRW